MSLYALGDLHLHFQTQLKASGQLTDPLWRNHEHIFRTFCEELVRPDDTLLLAGDHSWGRTFSECEKDLEYILSLPGRKILLRGNHDMFWDAKKTPQLNARFEGKLFFLQNNFCSYRDYALVGTKGYTFEGPFYVNRKGIIVGWDQDREEQARKLVDREAARLRISFEEARKAGFQKFLMFLHYPPTSVLEKRSVFTDLAEEYGAEQVIYAHCHGTARFHDSLIGCFRGIEYRLVSGDYLRWKPLKIFD